MKGEVVGFVKDAALLTPVGDMHGISSSTEVIPTGRSHMVPVGAGLLGRARRTAGPGRQAGTAGGQQVLSRVRGGAGSADPPHHPRAAGAGVRALDGLLTCGEGQRMGILAAGGGKSTLMGMLVKRRGGGRHRGRPDRRARGCANS